MVENIALEAVKKKTCAQLEDVILVRTRLIFLLSNIRTTYTHVSWHYITIDI